METSREDVSIAIRSAFLRKGTQQRFSLFALVVLSILFLIFEKIDARPINYFRSFVKDLVYRSSLIVSLPSKSINTTFRLTKDHIDLYKNYNQLKKDNDQLRNKIFESDYLILENTQLRKLIDEQVESSSNLVSSRVMLDKQSPYLNSFVIKSGANHKILLEE